MLGNEAIDMDISDLADAMGPSNIVRFCITSILRAISPIFTLSIHLGIEIAIVEHDCISTSKAVQINKNLVSVDTEGGEEMFTLFLHLLTVMMR